MTRYTYPSIRVLLLASSIGLSGIVQAQWSLSAIAGGGTGRINTDLWPVTSRGEYQVVDDRFSWLLGGNVSHKLSGPLSFSTGLHWSFIAGHDEYWSQGVKTMAEDRRIHYISIPMLVHVDIWRFRLGAGYQLGTPVVESGTFYRYPYANGFGEYSATETKELALKHTDFGAVGELSCRMTDRFDVGARYYYGLQDIKDHTDGIHWPLSNEQLVLTVSYRILSGSKPKKSAEEPGPVAPAEPVE